MGGANKTAYKCLLSPPDPRSNWSFESCIRFFEAEYVYLERFWPIFVVLNENCKAENSNFLINYLWSFQDVVHFKTVLKVLKTFFFINKL